MVWLTWRLECQKKSQTMDKLVKPSWVRGYQTYKAVWEAAIGEELVCKRNPNNDRDRYSVPVKGESNIIGDL